MYIFKPNKNNSGSALGINFGPDNKRGLACYVKLIRQDANSWNGSNGSFRNNTATESPNNVSVKLNQFEIGNIILTIRSGGKVEFKAYHGNQNGNVQVSLNRAQNNDPARQPVFFLSVMRNGSDKFFIPLSLAELETLRVFLEYGLQKMFAEEERMAQEARNKRQNQGGGNYNQSQGQPQARPQQPQPQQTPPQPPQQDGGYAPPAEGYSPPSEAPVEDSSDPFDYDNPF